MQALIFKGVNQPLSFETVVQPDAGPNQVLVDLRSAALNHRDNWMLKGQYPGLRPDIILGSDGAGIVQGREVLINPAIGWGDNPRFPSLSFHILGMPGHGTFAEKIAVDADRLVDKPAHLSFAEAAALPLAGLTAYRTLFTRCRLQPSERVLISGIGGGVALLACQFAIAVGAEVYVTSSSTAKIESAVKLGAKGGVDYRQTGWSGEFGKETGGFDVIVDGAGGPGFAELVRVTKPGARIGVYGGTCGPWQNVSPQTIFFRQVDILGSTMGSDQDFTDMITFVTEHQIVPIIDSQFDLADGNLAIKRMDQGLQFGKIVLAIA